MTNKKIINTISEVLVNSNISTAVIIEKESKKLQELMSKDQEYYFLKESIVSRLKNKENKVIIIDDYKPSSQQRIVNDTKELLWILKNTQIKNIKLTKDLDLSNLDTEERTIKANNLILDGNGYSIVLPKNNNELTNASLILKGNGITLKNITINIKDREITSERNVTDIIEILGNNIKLVNVNIKGNGGIKIADCVGVELNRISLKGDKSKNSAIRVESAEVTCKNIKIKRFKTGLESVGRKAKLTIKGKQLIDTQFHIRNNYKSGSIIKVVENKLSLLETVFCYQYFKLALN